MLTIAGPGRLLRKPKYTALYSVTHYDFSRNQDGSGTVTGVTQNVRMSVQAIDRPKDELNPNRGGDRHEARVWWATLFPGGLKLGDSFVFEGAQYRVMKVNPRSQHGFYDGEAVELTGATRTVSPGFTVT